MAAKRWKEGRQETMRERHRKGQLSRTDMEHFKQLLLRKRSEIVGSVMEMSNEALSKPHTAAAGDLSSAPMHMADVGSDTYQQELSLSLMGSERKMLKEIDDALRRIEAGTYGVCEGTGQPISRERLEAQPWARYSVEYARMVEQGQATEKEQPST